MSVQRRRVADFHVTQRVAQFAKAHVRQVRGDGADIRRHGVKDRLSQSTKKLEIAWPPNVCASGVQQQVEVVVELEYMVLD